VKTRLHRARLGLRQALADYFGERQRTAAGRTGHGWGGAPGGGGTRHGMAV